MNDNIETLAINTIRTLSIDAINQANSGHPGLPMGAAPMAYALWAHHLDHNPANAKWFNRDRFVLSTGHGSSMLYSLLHLAGYDVSLDDLKSFRKLNSKTPGHPEFGHTDGLNFLAGKTMDDVNKKAFQGTVLAHVDGGVPNLVIELDELTEFTFGEMVYFFEKACGISGLLLGVNPFDQPGVEAYKKNMFALLGKPGFEAEKASLMKRLSE